MHTGRSKSLETSLAYFQFGPFPNSSDALCKYVFFITAAADRWGLIWCNKHKDIAQQFGIGWI